MRNQSKHSHRAAVENELHSHRFQGVIKRLVRILNRSDVRCVDILFCAKGFDSPSNAGKGIWPREVSSTKGMILRTGLTRGRLDCLRHLDSPSRANDAPRVYQCHRRVGRHC